jgi:hypothetical protein
MIAFQVQANMLPDRDRDAVPDEDEINIYFTDPDKWDTDGDGYSDWVELTYGFSPHNPIPVRLEDNDQDGDGLTDRLELKYGSDMTTADTDGDGYSDYDEVMNGYDPKEGGKARLAKKIEIDLASQVLSWFYGDVRIGTTSVSSGKANSTPRGTFKITNKHPKAWSSYGLWMPYWNGLDDGKVGIHELPVWPSGYVEGEDHLGTPVSHGCIRVAHEPAEFIYEWAEVGTPVIIN